MENISRRSFLKGIAASAAGVAAASLAPAFASADEAEVKEAVEKLEFSWKGSEPDVPYEKVVAAYDTEVLVVGSGTAGWPAFASALENGAKAILIERGQALGAPKNDVGVMNCRLQQESVKEFPYLAMDKFEVVKDIVRYSASDIDQRIWMNWADESGELGDWYTDLLESSGKFKMWHEASVGNYEGGNRDKAYATGLSPETIVEGATTTEVLQEYCEGLGGQCMTETTLVKLVKNDDGRVIGAICTDAEGHYILINASKAVILATGGYRGNTEMLMARQPVTMKLASRVGSADNGSGIKAALWAGGHMQDSALSMFFNRTAIKPDQVSGYDAAGKTFWFGEQPFMKVNLRGERFCNESGLYEYLTHSVALQPEMTYCDIWDSTFAEDVDRFDMVGCCRLEPFDNGAPSNWTFERAWSAVEGLIDEGYVIKADTLEELAEKLGLPVETFLKTVERYNEFEAQGHDDDFGKVAYRLSRIDTPPYYGVRTSAWHLTTLDGVIVDPDNRVLDDDCNPIPGLYAAGDVTGGRFAHVYPNLCTGLACGQSMTSGRHAGRLAAMEEAVEIPEVEIGGEAAIETVEAGDGNGTYSAVATGMGTVKVTITFVDSTVSDVEIDYHEETVGIGQDAAPKLAVAIKEQNTPEVDGISGASLTSAAVVKAAKSCFEQAGVAY